MGIDIAPCSFFWAALLLLTVPLNWLLAAFFAATVHELCHIFLIRTLGYRIWSIQIGIGGAVIETEPMPYGRELLCALAGPVGSLLLVLTVRILPRVALCAAVQCIYNLIPAYPLDGGRILRCIAQCLLSNKGANRLCAVVEGIAILSIAAVALILAVRFCIGFAPVLFAGMLLIRPFLRKIPCKEKHLRVQ